MSDPQTAEVEARTTPLQRIGYFLLLAFFITPPGMILLGVGALLLLAWLVIRGD